MTEPTRLTDEAGGDELETSLLQLARREAPSLEGRRRILAAIAAGGAASLSGQTADAASATASKGAALKWSLIGAGALGVAAFTAFLLGSTNESARLPAAPSVVSEAVPTTLPKGEPAPAEVGPAPLTVNDLPPLKEPAAGAAASAVRQGSLADEVAQLQKAKLALKGGNPALALAELATYAQRFPRPMLGAEATVVRIEAMSASGDTARARALAEGFLAKNPSSPYAARLRSLTGAR
jgi:hypothetical protein